MTGKLLGLAGLLLTAFCRPLSASDSGLPKWNVHGFFAEGTSFDETRATFRGGGAGVERFLWKGLAIGGDVSALHENYYRAVGAFGHVGVQAIYHFRGEGRRVEPFVAFGPGAYFHKENGVSVHGGAGLIYWFHNRIGARFEFRAASRTYGDRVDGIMRVGLTFR